MTLIPLRRLRPAPAPAPPSGPPLVDPQARAVKYLRVSLTDHCNFRCTYCMPEAGVEQVARRELLTLAEVVLVVRAFAAWGVERVRLTGGEPTVRQGLVELVVARPHIESGRMHAEQQPRQSTTFRILAADPHHHRRAAGAAVRARIGKEIALTLETQAK